MLPSLHSHLADALPASVRLLIHHVTSEKYATPALFSAPPEELPEPTTAESHLLSVSIKHNGKALHVFALEVYVYETASLTTIFVSKADSTGYLHLLALPTGTPSPIKAVTTAFLDWLVKTKRRNNKRLLLSLFARAQNQYLFPGSIDNSGKHVLDDRQLIRWWCRVLNPILLRYGESEAQQNHQAHAHLIVPGLDPYETRSYFPRTSPESSGKPKWSATDPLSNLGKSSGLPPRCYIPRFPDDPKARFLLDLDDELPNEPEEETQPERGKSPGVWKSVKSLTQFWEFMSFRQECSAGRVVGFVWLVFEATHATDNVQETGDDNVGKRSISHLSSDLSQPQKLQVIQPVVSTVTDSMLSSSLRASQEPVTSLSVSVVPQPKDALDDQSKEDTQKAIPSLQDSNRLEQRDSSPSFKTNRFIYENLLLELEQLDYMDLEISLASTDRFLRTLSQLNDLNQDWGKEIVGNQIDATTPSAIPASAPTDGKVAGGTTSVNAVSTLSVKRKKQSIDETPAVTKMPAVNVLSSTTVRKKPKV